MSSKLFMQEMSKFHSTICFDKIVIYPAQEMQYKALNFMLIRNLGQAIFLTCNQNSLQQEIQFFMQ